MSTTSLPGTGAALPRLSAPDPAQLTAEQMQVCDAVLAGPRGQVRGPLALWLHRPRMALPAQALGQYCRYESSLTPAQSEFAILVLAQHWRAEYEWWAHQPLALQAGVAPAVIEALRTGGVIPFEDPALACIHEVLRTLHDTRHLPDTLYAQAAQQLGEMGLLDLVALAGYYTLISLTIQVFQLGLPEGEPWALTGQPWGESPA